MDGWMDGDKRSDWWLGKKAMEGVDRPFLVDAVFLCRLGRCGVLAISRHTIDIASHNILIYLLYSLLPAVPPI